MRVLHIIPESTSASRHFFLGNTKGVRGKTEYFNSRHIECDELPLKRTPDVDDVLLRYFECRDLRPYRFIFFEYLLFPKCLEYVRDRHPDIKLIVQSHNAEFFHHVHYAIAHLFHGRTKRLKWCTKHLSEASRKLYLDYVCARRADYVLSVTDWEKHHYWRFLTDEQKVFTVPTFLPRVHLETIQRVNGEKRPHCVVLASTADGIMPFFIDSLKNFNDLVNGLNGALTEWSFYVTGDFNLGDLNLSDRIVRTGFLESPFEILSESCSMALLSNFGFGFKTKIMDAIASNCYVIMPHKLYQRVPTEVRPFCIPIDTRFVSSFQKALEQSLRPPPLRNPNYDLREIAFKNLDYVFSYFQ